jgi:uncharacterized protein (DUF427 family)
MSEQTNSKSIRIPGPDHPITIERNLKRVVVSIAGKTVADSRDALILREAGYPAVQYIPRKDVDMTLLERSTHATYCPYKGDCAYYSIPSSDERGINAVWTYEAPYDAVADIRNHLAFYPDRVDAIEERDSETRSSPQITASQWLANAWRRVEGNPETFAMKDTR